MKQGKKYYLKWMAVIGGVLCGAGLLVAGAAFAAMGFRFDSYVYSSVPEEKVESFTFTGDEIESVEIDVDFCDIRVEKYDGRVPELTIASNLLGYQVEKGKLTVTEQEEYRTGGWKWYRLVNIGNSGSKEAVLKLPEGFSGSLDLKSDFGAIRVQDLKGLKELNLQGDNGNIRLSWLKVQKDLNVQANFGAVRVENCEIGGDLTVRDDSGDVTLEGSSFRRGDITMAFGQLNAGTRNSGIDCQSLSVQVDNGTIFLKEVNAPEGLKAVSKFGDIRLDKAGSQKFELESSNGSITGSIRGREEEYQILVEKEFGDSNLQSKLEGKYLLDISTNFGDIDIRFEP